MQCFDPTTLLALLRKVSIMSAHNNELVHIKEEVRFGTPDLVVKLFVYTVLSETIKLIN